MNYELETNLGFCFASAWNRRMAFVLSFHGVEREKIPLATHLGPFAFLFVFCFWGTTGTVRSQRNIIWDESGGQRVFLSFFSISAKWTGGDIEASHFSLGSMYVFGRLVRWYGLVGSQVFFLSSRGKVLIVFNCRRSAI